ncbi:NAD(P)/FAD-dependent oxidoreductase [Vagococcus zengguangii]|uniref:NAD(P)/FAD-dependent oxidoreductase n=1 Tax=Vagococcus zengguangii TaxID=2571750 RepID=A0A4D7CTW7_9ENTE|nr:NAD(P)/FAD-dependent oxidoreductase [Vagococcus zengguangii]QCI85837.1 NAD(P)/FAD-dependent oxidoreductase [Vagococcus zengguangii]TLG81778.1 NAD(P)/FAD-dependent oxidoreductase [Vagococcus zengguangii]
MYDITIIGAGITGASIAYELSKYDVKVCVLEAENDVAMKTTKANSAILHAGYDPKSGSLNAKLNVKGAALAKELCRKLDVPRKQIGSLVVAFSEEDLATIQDLYERGVANGVPAIQLLSKEETLAKEPNLNEEIYGALYAPSAAVVNPWEFTIALAEVAIKNGVMFHFNQKVNDIVSDKSGFSIQTQNQTFQTKWVINAAGVTAGDIHEMVAPPTFKIIPCRGEYYLLDLQEQGTVNHIVFQCPTKVGKGILVAPTTHGNIIVGPNAEDIASELVNTGEDVANTRHGLAEVAEGARKSVPNINLANSIRNFSGVRANTDREDFIIEKVIDQFYDVAGIKSPGLTAAPAIALHLLRLMVDDGLLLPKKDDYVDSRSRIHFNEATIEEKQTLIKENPDYGRIICRCENITEGDIRHALHQTLPAVSVEGVKRRTIAGMGRCQGGFCGPRVVEIIADELNISPLEVDLDRFNSHILTAPSKEEKQYV